MTPTAKTPAEATPADMTPDETTPAIVTSSGVIPADKPPAANPPEACLSLPSQAGPSASNASLTGTYLNQFDEMVKLIEKLPDRPELIGDIMNWQPMSYNDYFNAAAMPGRVSAADVYASLNRCMRQNFEGVAGDLDRKALGAVAVIRRHYRTHGEARPEIMTEICARAGTHLREVLGKANDLVSHVASTPGQPQRRRFGTSQL